MQQEDEGGKKIEIFFWSNLVTLTKFQDLNSRVEEINFFQGEKEGDDDFEDLGRSVRQKAIEESYKQGEGEGGDTSENEEEK